MNRRQFLTFGRANLASSAPLKNMRMAQRNGNLTTQQAAARFDRQFRRTHFFAGQFLIAP